MGQYYMCTYHDIIISQSVAYSQHTVRCRYNAVSFLPNPHKIHSIARPLGLGMGCYLWFDTDFYSALVNPVLYEISCYIGPRYNGTRL